MICSNNRCTTWKISGLISLDHSKHDEWVRQCRVNVGLLIGMLAQHYNNNASTYRFCLVGKITQQLTEVIQDVTSVVFRICAGWLFLKSRSVSRGQEALIKCCFIAGPATTTLDQHKNNIKSPSRILVPFTATSQQKQDIESTLV